MTDVLAIGLQSMTQDMARLDRISMNLANATTPAYKREVVSALAAGGASFAQAVNAVAQPMSDGSNSLASPAGRSETLLIQSDTRPGTLKTTGQALDVALSGPGYFEVLTDTGTAYTRQGGWRVDARGRLVTAQGNAVMGRSGEIVLNHPNPVIDAAGQVFEVDGTGLPSSTASAQLKIVQFEREQEHRLQRLGGGLVSYEQAPAQASEAEYQVRQGFLENSNVSSMQEMTHLIQTMRHFEAMQKVTLGYDEMIGTAVRKLGELG